MTRSDLPADVLDRAAKAASDARREYDNATLYVNEAGRDLHIADAVAAVVAEEIRRDEQEKAVNRVVDLRDRQYIQGEVWVRLTDVSKAVRDG